MADQNLKQIQFKRTSTENKAPSADIVARGEIALNTHGRTLAIYTKDENDKVVQLAGKGVPFLDTSGTLSVGGTTTLKDNVTVAPNKSISFETTDLSGKITRHIVGKCATNDGWYIGAGGVSNNGILEIGTIDDGVETIQFVQRGARNVEARKLVLLDSSGNTTLPGDLRLSTNKTVKISNGSTLTLEMGVGANDAYIKNLRGSGVLQLTNDSNLTFRNSQVYYAMDGRGPGKGGTLLTNVENERQLKQDNFPVTTGSEVRWTKVALLKDPGLSQSRLQLMVTNGGNYCSTRGSIDFIDCSARSFPSSLTSSNIRTYLQVRRLGDPALDDTNQLRYSLLRTSEGLELWFMQSAFIGGVKVALLSIAGYTEYYLPTGYTTSATAPEGLVESTAIRIYDEVNKPNVVDGTEGVLSINRGGTGGTSSAAARNNLGLGTAAIRDVGEGTGNLMEVGAFGLGGTVGAGNIAKGSLAETVKYLNTYGTCFFRVEDNIATIPQYSPSIYVKTGSNQLILSANHRNGVISVVTTDKTDGTNLTVSQVYTTLNKPTPSDVNAVAKTGDTMSGDLTISKTSPGLFLNATNDTGNSVIWFRNKGVETGAVWAIPNTESSGEVRIRARTTAGVTGGEFKFKSDGTFTSPGSIDITNGAFNGKTVNTEYANFNNTSSTKTEQTVSISGSQHTPLVLNRPTNSNLSIGFKLSGMNMKRLGIDINGDIRYGEAENQTQNPWLLTSETVDRWIVNFGRDINVAGAVNSTGGFTGPVTAYNLTDARQDLNDLTLNYTEPGHIKVYSCRSAGGGSKITNKPSGVGGNFIVIVECIRKVNDTDYTNRQVLVGSDSKRSWERWLNVSGTTKSWTPWRVNIVNGNDDDVSFKSVTTTTGNLNSGNDLIVANNTRVGGNLGLGGASSTTYADKGVVIGQGSALLETTDGRVIVGSSGAGRSVELRPGGPTQTNNLVKVTATAGSGGDTAIEYAQGAKIRANNGGALIISSKQGQTIYLRPQGDANGGNEVRVDSNTMVVTGGFEAQDTKIAGNLNVSEDNRMIVLGKNSDLGLVKKSGMPGKMAIGKSNSFTVMASTNTNNQINPGDTFNDIFKVDADGNQTVYGNAQVNRQLTVASNTNLNSVLIVQGNTTLNADLSVKGNSSFTGVINADGNINVASGKFVIAGQAPTDNSHLTNKKYVDDKVASAISNAGDTYLPLAGGTVTGNLNITGSQLKTTSLWVTGASALNGNLEVGGNVVSNNGIGSFVGAVDVKAPAADNGTTHLWFRHSNGGERGVIYMPKDNNTMMGLRAGGSEWQLDGPSGQLLGPGARWRVHADGNLQGDVYGGYITEYINNRFNQCAQWVRTGARWDIGQIGRPAPGKTVDPGWVMIGLNANGNEAIQNMRIIAGRLQVWKPGVEWIDSAT
ncbi:tail fiber protein [Klebsiella phage vB_Kpn_F48]|uniref:Tail fiber protein n=1 Tax=Klebsiella phage vB_Kpn_F48 TaxID=2070028 RepID=A0A2I6UFN0_9CAUD|nr:tail fiber protein [Klebsiella phage vB_Kpn_F48]AUO78781.1 tail fiber protein [Klebsiella phage vB_Kpn_F48]